MKHCPITLEVISKHENYSRHGLRMLSPQLKNLAALPLSAAEQRLEATTHAGKMSIQGVQPKLSARLKVKEGCFEIVDQNGHYILKPQNEYYAELPENEALTMSLAGTINIQVPVHGLLYSKDTSMTYFIKRFDRDGHNKKIAMEDFAQLSGMQRDTKYNGSMEKVADIISTFCTFPVIEFIKFFRLTIFNFLIGNEDMHLKNFSLVTMNGKTILSPAYDLLNSTIVQKEPHEEMALPLKGKKSNLSRRHLIDYFGKERLGLNQNVIEDILQEIQQALPSWFDLIDSSFLSIPMQKKYCALLEQRCQRLGFQTDPRASSGTHQSVKTQ